MYVMCACTVYYICVCVYTIGNSKDNHHKLLLLTCCSTDQTSAISLMETARGHSYPRMGAVKQVTFAPSADKISEREAKTSVCSKCLHGKSHSTW